MDRPSYLVKTGDTISITDRAREMPSVVESVTRGPTVRLPSFVARDPDDDFSGRVIGVPSRRDVPFIVNEAAVVEFYAR